MTPDWRRRDGSEHNIRRFDPERDTQALEHFKCNTPGVNFTRRPQRVIRDFPGVLADEAEDDSHYEAFVCEYEDQIIGVVVFGPTSVGSQRIILALGVVRSQRRNYVGIALKQRVLDTCYSRGERLVTSEVHIRNDAMNALNAKLGVATTKVQGDNEYLLTLARLGATADDERSVVLCRDLIDD